MKSTTPTGMISKRRWLFAAAALLVFASLAQTACLRATEETAPRQAKQYTVEQFLNTTEMSGSSFSPDEKSILISSNKSGIFNAYTVPVAGGEPQPLTKSTTESTFAISYFPNDKRILYSQDRGGNDHLYLLEADGKERDLTPGEKVKAQFLKWSRDDKAFYYSTNERDERFFDIYKMDIATFQRQLLYQDTTGYDFGDISNDEKFIAFSKSNTTSDSNIYLYNLAAKKLKHITPHEGEVAFTPASFDVNSRYLYYLTDEGSEFAYLARHDLAAGKSETVEKANWDIEFTYFSHNGKYRVVGINEDARTRIKIYDETTGQPIDLPAFPEGELRGVNISKSEKLMAFYFNGDRSPDNLHLYDFATKQVTKLTESLNPEIAPADLVEAEVIRYKSFDGLEIPSILYKPHQASASNKMPALVWVHGGPGGQTRKGYSGLRQYFANHGYVVLGVNNRGSSGYGKTFFKADDQKHGREPLWDCVEAKQYLASLGYVDTTKIGIIGGSYGGYMTLAALAFKPEEFAVGVDIFGVSNRVRTLESVPPYWESFRKALYQEMGDPQKDKEMLREISPLFHADKITKPLLVLQGANDPRVIKPESDEIVEAIKKKGGIVQYIVFPDEGHGFTKKANERRAYKGILDFLDKYLKGSKTAA
jgi:dipeptidyl aminopeptidase/acylaminoacyl peptidase